MVNYIKSICVALINFIVSIDYIRIAAPICRIVLAATFILSGFTKIVDPWGVAMIIDDYFVIYGLEFMQPASMILSIGLCGMELMIGCMLLFNIGIRLVSTAAFASMVFFTILTFLSATWLPVADCGCFGEAIKLTPWETFIKNVILLPISFLVLYRYRAYKTFAFTPIQIQYTSILFVLSISIGISSYRHLPWIDFLPYKIGVNIYDEIHQTSSDSGDVVDIVLVYRNIATGELQEFALEDSQWQDDTKWEWVETKTDVKADAIEALVSDFAVMDAQGDATNEILTTPGRLYMICVESFAKIAPDCDKRLAALVSRAYSSGDAVVCLTPEPLGNLTYKSFGGGRRVKCYNADATLLKTMLRANVGVVELLDGTIVDKKNCRDIDL